MAKRGNKCHHDNSTMYVASQQFGRALVSRPYEQRLRRNSCTRMGRPEELKDNDWKSSLNTRNKIRLLSWVTRVYVGWRPTWTARTPGQLLKENATDLFFSSVAVKGLGHVWSTRVVYSLFHKKIHLHFMARFWILIQYSDSLISDSSLYHQYAGPESVSSSATHESLYYSISVVISLPAHLQSQQS